MLTPRVTALMLIALLQGASGCQQSKPKVADDVIAKMRRELPGITPECLRKVQFGGFEVLPERVDRCFEMTPPRRWKGLWRDQFEGQRFCQNPLPTCSDATPGDFVWLDFADGARPLTGGGPGQVYAIEFVGRRTLRRGFYGHMGMSQHEMLVDRVVSISPANLP